MKCRLIRPLHRRNPKYKQAVAEQFARRGKHYPIPRWVPAPAGTEIEHKDAWKLVANGDAEPADDECFAMVEEYYRRRGQTYEAGREESVKQRELLDKAIDPKHHDAYHEGRMDGYDKRGRPTLDGQLVELEEDQSEDQTVIVITEDAKE